MTRLLRDKRYRHLASDTYIATLSLLSVDYPVDDARVLEAARERDSCRRQAFTISHSFASSLTYKYVVLLYRRHFYQLMPFSQTMYSPQNRNSTVCTSF